MASLFLRWIACSIIITGFSTTAALAAARGGETELFLFGQFSLEDETTGSIFGSDFEVTFGETFGIGVGIGHNITDNLNLNATLLVAEASVDVETGGFDVSDDATLLAPDVNIDWNILDTPITPFLTAGTGLMAFFGDDNETEFSYGVGGGLRLDLSDAAFVKVWYRARWFELEETDDSLMLHTFNVGIGLLR